MNQYLKEFCDKHTINESTSNAELEAIYRAHISQDRVVLGDYRGAIETYCESVLPKQETLTPEEYILLLAHEGYDRAIEALTLTSTLVNAETKGSLNTPLHHATRQGFYHTTCLLLSHGANPQKKNRQQEKPIDRVLVLTIRQEAKNTLSRIQTERTLLFKLLLQYENDPVATFSYQTVFGTLGHQLARFGYKDLLLELLGSHDPKIILDHRNNQRNYPIHVAILNNQLVIADCLFEKVPCTAQQRGDTNRLPLHLLATTNYIDLLEPCYRAYPQAIAEKDEEESTPWMIANSHRAASSDRMMHKLEELGAQPHQDNSLHHRVR